MAIESKMRRSMSFGQGEGASGGRGFAWPWVLVLGVLLGAGWLCWTWLARPPSANPDAYQAVFLDNGQTYFGKLSDRFGDTVLLSDVYYFDFSSTPGDDGADMRLLRLGSEVHGPESSMRINTDHILYTEDLRADSKVAQAIAVSAANQP